MKIGSLSFAALAISIYSSAPAFSESINISEPDFPDATNTDISYSDIYSADNSDAINFSKKEINAVRKANKSRGDTIRIQSKQSSKASPNLQLASTQAVTTMASPPPQYSFGNCTAFSLGSGLLATHEAQGQVKCYNTYSATDIKVEAQASSQPAGVNYDVFLYFYNHNTGSTEFKASSLNTGNVNDFATSVMPAGNYIVYTRATSGSSTSAFVVGALGFSGYDQHEANETLATATQVVGNQIMTGNTDHNSDIDYYVYTTAADQSELDVTFNSSNHVAQYVNSSGNWSALNASGTTAFQVNPNGNYYFRVINTAATNNPLVNYQLSLTRKAEFIGNAQVTNDENLTNVCCGLDAHSRINFTGYAQDANHVTVPYGKVRLRVYAVGGEIVTRDVTANSNGYFDETLNFTPCTGGGYYGQGSGATSPPAFWYLGMDPQTLGLGFFQHCSP